jgi:hypothetical protein
MKKLLLLGINQFSYPDELIYSSTMAHSRADSLKSPLANIAVA